MEKTPENLDLVGMDFNGYVEPELSSNELYPEYIKKEVLNTVKQVISIQEKDSISFGFMTDLHYAINLNDIHPLRLRRTLNAYKEICKGADIDLLVLGGDHCNDGNKKYKCDCYRALRSELNGINYFPINGNHDDNCIWDCVTRHEKATNHLTHGERYDLFYDHLPAFCTVFGDTKKGIYYYYDNNKVKVRYIFLDTGDVPYIYNENGGLIYFPQSCYAFSQKQVDWLVNNALKFNEDGWTVVIFTHVPPLTISAHTWESTRENISILHDILYNYKNGNAFKFERDSGIFAQSVNVDFSMYHRADVAAVISGHDHIDNQLCKDGIHYIATANSVMYVGNDQRATKRADGDKTELLFDIITLNKVTHTLTFKRVGAGNDRIFKY